jgi:hypothetical protein
MRCVLSCRSTRAGLKRYAPVPSGRTPPASDRPFREVRREGAQPSGQPTRAEGRVLVLDVCRAVNRPFVT